MVGVDTDADLKASSPSKFLARGSFVEQLRQAEDLFDGDPKVEIRVLVMHHSRMVDGATFECRSLDTRSAQRAV
jgi:hypothetical protein